MPKFIDDRDVETSTEPETIGFLVERRNYLTGASRWLLLSRPAHTNQSHEPRLTGWCGAWNDTHTNARGLARVVRVTANGRVQIAPVAASQLAAALEALGYPELTP